MTQINAKIVADSKNEFGNRITTMVVTFPRFILAELNTHRMMSRNSASSRAIPFEKMLDSVENNPFTPIAWQKDHKGMQGTEYFLPIEEGFYKSNAIWNEAKRFAVEQATLLSENGTTKQLCNRLLEPFMWHTVIITATEWENFFALRCPVYTVGDVDPQGIVKNKQSFRSWRDFVQYQMNVKKCNRDVIESFEAMSTLERLKLNTGQAEIHMMALAEAMWDAMNKSTPEELKVGEWHIPFGDTSENPGNMAQYVKLYNESEQGQRDGGFPPVDFVKDIEIKIATARCARVSYTVVGEEDKPDNYENDVKLHDRLLASGHMSPFEHCAKTMNSEDYIKHIRTAISEGEGYSEKDGYTIDIPTFFHDSDLGWSGNFKGFVQYRKTLLGENITK